MDGRQRMRMAAPELPKDDHHTGPTSPLICTIGHSNRSISEFIDLLTSNQIVRVLDIRTIPRSRTNPQFGQDSLSASLSSAGIGYTYLSALGGLRRTRKDSINQGWRNLSFRGYADYMQSSEFAAAVEWVAELARTELCTLMCAEAVPWRCHRSMVADALLIRGVRVEDILGPKGRKPRTLTPFAKVEGKRITYPSSEASGRQLHSLQFGAMLRP
jgi:uncharacterized protein (DUF488 family)